MENYPQGASNPGAPGVEQPPPQPSQPSQPSYGQSQTPHDEQNRYLPGGPTSGPASFASVGYRERNILAIILIGAGVLFLLQQLTFFGSVGDYILLLLGGIFLYAYFSSRPGFRVGFLIPGAILLGIGVGQALSRVPFIQEWGPHNLSGLTLGLGFCLIWALERRHWWALIPGGILVITSLSEGWMIGRLWPLALVLLGVYLLYDQYRRR